MLRILPASLMTNPIVMMGHPVLVAEAGFLLHESVTTATIPGLPDAQRIRWRFVDGILCVCSYYATHGGMNAHFRTRYWEELVASVRHTQRTLPGVPIVLSGDANVWWLAFHFGLIAPCFHMYTSFSKVVVYVFGMSLERPHAGHTHCWSGSRSSLHLCGTQGRKFHCASR